MIYNELADTILMRRPTQPIGITDAAVIRTQKQKGFAMSIFSSILNKLGIEKETPAPVKPGITTPKPAAPPPSAPQPAMMTPKPVPAKPPISAPKPATMMPKPAPQKPPISAPKPATMMPRPPSVTQSVSAPKPVAAAQVMEIPVIDVVAKLEAMAAKRPEKLNWKISISDLLFLLGMDNSFKARKELAEELGCPPDLMGDSTKMNTWLHKTVLAKIAENGGNIPKELLD